MEFTKKEAKFQSKKKKLKPRNFQVQVGTRTFEAHELQKLIPQLEEAISRKDAQLRQQQTIVEGHIKRISELEGEVTTLQVSNLEL